MPSPIEMQQMQMAQRMGANPGASVGGMQPMQGAPPPSAMGQQPPSGAPSQIQPLLDQVLDILVQGNPADLQALGQFFAKIQQLVQEHEVGQGMGTNVPNSGTPPAPATPLGGTF